MLAKYKNVFDATAPTDNANDNIGAYIRAANGDLIGDQTIAGANWLNTTAALFDGAGTALTSTLVSGKQALDVNMVNTILVDTNGVYNGSTNLTPDTEGLIAHTRAATPDQTNQTFRSTGAQANASGVTAANVYGLDTNSFLMGYNGTTWDRATSTSGALDVNIKSQTGTVTVSDAALANSAVLSSAATVTTTEAAILAAQLANRKYALFQNRGNKSVFLGATGVTTANGFEMSPGSAIELRMGPAVSLHAIASGGSQDIRALELS